MADYVTVAEFLKRFDQRDVGELVSDEDIAVHENDLPTNDVLAACIGDASGDIDAALMAGKNYSAAELEGLTGNALSKLRRMCSEITMFYLLDRRPNFDSDRLDAHEKMRNRHLERLRRGENIFNLDAHKDASVVSVDGPTIVEYASGPLWRDQSNNYFPARRTPNNR